MRKEIWNLMLDADMNERYWSHLSRRYYLMEMWIKIFLAIMASSTVASWKYCSEYEIIWKVLSFISALTAIALPILNWPKTIERMVFLTENWSTIRSDYELLWLRVKKNIGDDSKFTKELIKLKNRENTCIQKEANLPKYTKLLRKCQKEVITSRGISQQGEA